MGSLSSSLLTFLLFSYLSCFHVLVLVSAKVFISIDCGSSSLKPYTDDNSIEWVGDDQYIQTGEVRNIIEKDQMYGSDPHVMDTLREFPTRKKNCYSIDINKGKSEDHTKVERVLVRASFFYGNYDNKSSPPTFNLQFNGNNWTQVITDTCLTYVEVVYSLHHGNTVTVCLAQTHRDNVPFISAIEVRSLDSDMYSYVDSNYPLFFMSRTAYGTSTNNTIRYPEDSYDRIWQSVGPLSNSSGLLRVRNSSPSIKVDIADKIPETLFMAAIMPVKASKRNLWFSGWVPDPKVPMHFNAYFSEVIKLDSTQKRSFNIYLDTYGVNGSNPSFNDYGIVNPPYGHALQVHLNNVSVESYVEFYEVYMQATNDSTLGPLINALEGYTIGDKLVQGTNSKDVNSLALLQKNFIQLQDWQGDPCLPYPFTWDWVDCDSDTDSPRITTLYLNDVGLVRTLPDFSDMDALETIDLGSNSLTGKIPEFLGTLPKLKVLNLADNDFSGAIPSSLLNNINLKLTVSGNPNLSTNNNTSTNRNSTEPKIPSTSSRKTSITSTIPIIILGSVIIQMFDSIFGLLL
ncbi:probable LRR receptor-like serine/threonine-protein kinase At1g51810 [Papaver somniferum]|uniref:probable LRR receptor-like serine/threonine-protein kinase At1g51810 n=1 Tax=Papaver somniferum TaxID=3469 RepID=UPI000E6FA995|nr:probable LRR receptor-like serine/threonine-protein kinase At1g51810 [Papaver somniferum]